MAIALLWLLAVGLVFVGALNRLRIARSRRRRLELGFARSRELLLLLRACQQHRGTHGALLGPLRDDVAVQRLDILRKEVAAGIRQLDAAGARVPMPEGWEAFCDGWRELQRELSQLDRDASFERHSRLNALLLELIWVEAMTSGILCSRNLSARARGHQAFRRLPALAEQLGQIRALAVGAAAQGHCSPAGRARLVELLDGIGRRCAMLPGRQTAALLERIAREVLATPGVSVEPERLYRDITRQVDAVFCSTRDLLQELQREQLVPAPRPTRLR